MLNIIYTEPRILTDDEINTLQNKKDLLKSKLDNMINDKNFDNNKYVMLLNEYFDLLDFILKCKDVYLKKGYVRR